MFFLEEAANEESAPMQRQSPERMRHPWSGAGKQTRPPSTQAATPTLAEHRDHQQGASEEQQHDRRHRGVGLSSRCPPPSKRRAMLLRALKVVVDEARGRVEGKLRQARVRGVAKGGRKKAPAAAASQALPVVCRLFSAPTSSIAASKTGHHTSESALGETEHHADRSPACCWGSAAARRRHERWHCCGQAISTSASCCACCSRPAPCKVAGHAAARAFGFRAASICAAAS